MLAGGLRCIHVADGCSNNLCIDRRHRQCPELRWRHPAARVVTNRLRFTGAPTAHDRCDAQNAFRVFAHDGFEHTLDAGRHAAFLMQFTHGRLRGRFVRVQLAAGKLPKPSEMCVAKSLGDQPATGMMHQRNRNMMVGLVHPFERTWHSLRRTADRRGGTESAPIHGNRTPDRRGPRDRSQSLRTWPVGRFGASLSAFF